MAITREAKKERVPLQTLIQPGGVLHDVPLTRAPLTKTRENFIASIAQVIVEMPEQKQDGLGSANDCRYVDERANEQSELNIIFEDVTVARAGGHTPRGGRKRKLEDVLNAQPDDTLPQSQPRSTLSLGQVPEIGRCLASGEEVSGFDGGSLGDGDDLLGDGRVPPLAFSVVAFHEDEADGTDYSHFPTFEASSPHPSPVPEAILQPQATICRDSTPRRPKAIGRVPRADVVAIDSLLPDPPSGLVRDRLLSAATILVPLHLPKASHWVLVVFVAPQTTLLFDSLPKPDRRKIEERLAEVKRIVVPHCGPRWKLDRDAVKMVKCPRQQNGIDCGVAVLVNGIHFLTGRSPEAGPNYSLWSMEAGVCRSY